MVGEENQAHGSKLRVTSKGEFFLLYWVSFILIIQINKNVSEYYGPKLDSMIRWLHFHSHLPSNRITLILMKQNLTSTVVWNNGLDL